LGRFRIVAVTHFAQDFEKELAGSWHVKKGFSSKTTAGDEMEMTHAVATFQTMLGHVSTPALFAKPAKSGTHVVQLLPRAKMSVHYAPGRPEVRKVSH
jgi:hypothetical protein